MDAPYQPFRQQAVDLQHRLHDSLDDHNHPLAHVLQREVTELVNDFESNRNPRSVEERIKQIQHGLIQMRAQGDTVMDYNQNQSLHHSYEQMRENVRRLPHY